MASSAQVTQVRFSHAQAGINTFFCSQVLTTLPCEGEEDIGNWVLLAKAGRVLTVPFVASGGCATGSQLAAAIALGAEGVNMGTRFMATKEAPIHDNIKQALVDNDERSTTHIFRTLHNTERV